MKYYEANPQKAICLDVETTGVDPDTAEILQLSIIDYNGNVLFNEYIKPDRAKIWPGAEAVHHISPLKVSNKPRLGRYHDELKRIFDGAELVISYNGDHYDIPIIARYGFPELKNKPSFDVMLEFAPVYGAWDDYHGGYTWQKLNVCANYYGYHGEDNFHDSLEDARATLYCYKKITDGLTLPSDITNSDPAMSIDQGFDVAELVNIVIKILNRMAISYRSYSNLSHLSLEEIAKSPWSDKAYLCEYGFCVACNELRKLALLNKQNLENLIAAFDNAFYDEHIEWGEYVDEVNESVIKDIHLSKHDSGPMGFRDFFEYWYREMKDAIESFFGYGD